MATAFPSSETAHGAQDDESSNDSDDTVMREIDEFVLALAKEGNKESSSAVVVLPQGSDEGAFPHTQDPRSPPPSFEDYIEEEVIATLAEGVRDPPNLSTPFGVAPHA